MSLFSDLVAKANLIKNETVDEANSADRIGQMFLDVINFAAATSGIMKGMTVEWDLNYAPIPPGFVLSDGYGGIKCNGVTVPDKRGKFSIGYDPAKFPLPYDDAIEGKGIENYGKVGNIGGSNTLELNVDQLPAHSFFTVSKNGRGDADTLMHSPEGSVIATEATGNVQDDDNNAYKLYAAPTGSEADSGKTNTIGKGKPIDKRQRYITACYITKVSDDVESGSVDLSNYYTKKEVDAKLENSGSGLTATQVKTISRTLITASSASTSTITLDVVNQVQVDSNNGNTDVALAFSNLPAVSCESFLTVKNNRAAAFNLVLPTSTFASGGITYSFTLMVATPLAIPAAKSAELHFIFVFIDETNCNIRIAGGVEV